MYCLAKTKALISFAVTAKLICVFVFAYANCWFSHEAAQIIFFFQILNLENFQLNFWIIVTLVRGNIHYTGLFSSCMFIATILKTFVYNNVCLLHVNVKSFSNKIA